MNHKGKRIFISGIPTSGKSYLARKLAKKVSGIAVELDSFREGLSKDERYKKWTNFYLDKDEYEYLTAVSADKKWQNLVAQSEGLWPAFLEEINKYSHEQKPIIFEGVNILPHLAKRDLNFPGIILLDKSLEKIITRNKTAPRWGSTSILQELEAKMFFEVERPRYKKEAIKYGYLVFQSADTAFEKALKLLQN